MSIRFHSIRAFGPAACLLSAMAVSVAPSFSQQQPASQPATAAQTTPAAPAPASKEPDYPDPRRFFIGLTGLSPLQTDGPDLRGGEIAARTGTYSSLFGLGKPYRFVVQGEAGIPISRTGTIYADYERYHGDGNQILPQSAFINNFSYTKDDRMRSDYYVQTGRVYLDDLLYPHKFPVSKFRLKSIWGVRFVTVQQTTISPTADDVSGVPGGSFAVGSYSIFYPEFGLAAEYAPSRHTVFRVDGAGFSFPHRSTITEGAATLAWRKQHFELLMGVKAFHFKTSPKKEDYVQGTFVSPFIGVRWYF